MTIGGWLGFLIISACIIALAALFFEIADGNKIKQIATIIIAIVLIVSMFFGIRWYFTKTSYGEASLVDERHNLQKGSNRTITVYTADGKVLAKYEGKIDISPNDGYVKFTYDNKIYTYYNCFVECIKEY